MAVTQKQIARELGVSQCVVSYAFNDDPRVTPATRERVLRAAEELGYDFAGSREARALIAQRYGKRVRSGLVATVLPSHHFGGTPAVQIPFYQEFLGGIEAEAEARGSAILLCSSHRPNLGSFLASHHVDGVISMDDEEPLQRLIANFDAPCCILGLGSDGVPNIACDSRAAIELTTQHLIDLGHRHIGFLGYVENHYEGRVRPGSYRDTLLRNGIIPDPAWCYTEALSDDQFPPAIIAMLQRAPQLTALVCFNDVVAVKAVKTLRGQGLRVPEDISITGVDNTRGMFSDTLEITSVAYDRAALGRRAVQWVYGEHGPQPNEPRRELAAVQLAVHASTAAPRPDLHVCRETNS